jgi:WD40 repeat protein
MTQATRCVAAHRVDDVAFSPDAKSVAIASSGWFGGTLQLFDIDSGTVRWRYRRARTVDFTEGAFSADGSLLCVGGSDKATILDAGDGHVVRVAVSGRVRTRVDAGLYQLGRDVADHSPRSVRPGV